MKKLLNDEQVKEIKKIIDKELEVRCIKVQTSLILDEENNFVLSSTFFQTVPVLHTRLSIEDFGGNAKKDKDNKNVVNFWIRVHCRYYGNGASLFSITGMLNEFNDVFGVNIKNDVR